MRVDVELFGKKTSGEALLGFRFSEVHKAFHTSFLCPADSMEGQPQCLLFQLFKLRSQNRETRHEPSPRSHTFNRGLLSRLAVTHPSQITLSVI